MVRPRSHTSQNPGSSAPSPPSVGIDVASLVAALDRHAASLDGLRAAVEQQTIALQSSTRYTFNNAPSPGLVDEREMARVLQISPRSLAEHRRRRRLQGCWVKNGKTIRWNVDATLAAWSRGLP